MSRTTAAQQLRYLIAFGLVLAAAPAHANVISLDPGELRVRPHYLFEIDVYIDFTDATLGGAFDVTYDPEVLDFWSFTFDETFLNDIGDPALSHLPDDCFETGAPNGGCAIGDGELNAIAFGAFEGIQGHYLLGTLKFTSEVFGRRTEITLSTNDAPFGGFYTVGGTPMDVTFQGATVVVTPLPGALWLLLGAVGALPVRAGLARRSGAGTLPEE